MESLTLRNLSWFTKRHHENNLKGIYKILISLNHPTAPIKMVSPHTFRHTFAKLFIINGGNTLALQNLLGHSTLEMVRHYVNLWGTDLQAMHRQFSPVDKLF